MRAVNAYSKLDYPEAPTLFFEFHGSAAGVAEQAEMVGELAESTAAAASTGRPAPRTAPGSGRRGTTPIRRRSALRPGAKAWATDVCVPISRLADCCSRPRRTPTADGLVAPIVGHVGDGNFHVSSCRPGRPGRVRARRGASRPHGRRARSRWAAPAPASTASAWARCAYLEQEHGEAVELMRTIKRALDPQDIMNPGKVIRLAPDDA